MKLLVAAIALMGLACSIAPVVTDPSQEGGARYSDCRRAAKDYCRDGLGVSEAEMKKCVAESTFQCISAGGR
jgi:hypothetical protein